MQTQKASNSFVRSTLISLTVGGALLLAIVVSSLYLVYKTQDYVEAAIDARVVRSAASDMLSTLQDAESGQRGYLIALDDSFLDSYRDSIKRVEGRERALEQAVADSRYFSIEVPRMRQLLESKLNEMRETIDLANSGRVNEALARVRDQTGLEIMNDLRAILTNLIQAADARIADKISSQLRFTTVLQLVTIIGGISIVGLLTGTVIIIRRYIREILAAREEMRNLNSSLEERVRERTEDLIQANNEIQRYAYIVTHDLRAPLVNIMGFTAELSGALQSIKTYFEAEAPDERERKEAELAVSEDLPEAIDFIRSSTRKMDGLINAILKISRDGRRQLKPEHVDLGPLIEEASNSIQHQLSETGGEIEVASRVRNFISDRFSLEQIIGNLLDNAVKYRQPGRPLHIEVNAFMVNRLRIGIDVTDNGRGIAAEDHERVFELFRRSGTQDSKGEGIGLAHVRSLVRNMGGDIQVRSELGKGTTFMIRLPLDLSQFVGSVGQ